MKVNGNKKDFAYLREDGSRMVIGYDLKELENGLYEWHEVYLPKKQVNQVTLQVVKDAIIGDIDAQTDAKILNSYQWTPEGGEPITVWLSEESQRNFSEAHRLQTIPVKFKLNEDENKQPIYHTFETFEELDSFYLGGVTYINQCLNEGWVEKDSIDWTPYEELFPTVEPNNEVEE